MAEKATILDRRTVLKGGASMSGAAMLGSLAGCTGIMGGGGGGSITVGSKQFTEQQLLGLMSVKALKENTDASINDKTQLGGSTTNFEALKSGDIDHYWEYTGTAWAVFPPKHDKVITKPDELYNKLAEEFKSEYNIELLKKGAFDNTYVLAGSSDWVEKTGVKTMTDFAEYVKNGNTDFLLVMDAEFAERQDGWPGLTKHYGFEEAAKDIKIKNVGPSLGYQIVGKGEAQITMGFNTNPKIAKWNLHVLKDDKDFFPVYNPAPFVKGETLEKVPGMKEPLNTIASNLDTETMRGLNKQVAIDGKKADTVAEEFLTEIGVL